MFLIYVLFFIYKHQHTHTYNFDNFMSKMMILYQFNTNYKNSIQLIKNISKKIHEHIMYFTKLGFMLLGSFMVGFVLREDGIIVFKSY